MEELVRRGDKATKTMTPIFSILLVIVVVACGPQPAKRTPDEITLQLKWLHQAQFAGFYMAQEKGYYAKENIKVTFLEGGQNIDIAQRVVSGQADFGVLTPEFIFMRLKQGEPLTAIAAIYRRSAAVFVAKADSGIVRPSDFTGKTVAVTGSGGAAEFELLFRGMMKKAGLDLSKVKMVPYDPAYTAFYDGKVEVTPCYSTGGLIKLRQKGLRLNLIWPSDYGIHFYSDTLVATDRLISEKPHLVTRFLRASLKGWQDAVEDYRQAVTVTLEYSRIKDRDLQMAMMEAMLPLVHTGEDQIGWMKDEVWRGMHRILSEQRLLARPFDVNRAYTLRFLNEIYGEKAK
jgi:NitT/TauT family transport system substrate-binding protein